MSGINGDKSRFHRERKQKIARRKRLHEMVRQLAAPHKAAVSVSEAKAKTESA